MIASLLFSSTLLYIAWTLVCLECNVRQARALDVPVVRIPFGVNNYIWVIFQPFVWRTLEYLPIQWSSYPDFVRYSHRNWHFLEKSRPTATLGPAWALVSPEGISLHFADPDIIDDIFSRWRDFVRPIQKYRMLAIYGPSVFTVGLDDWPRHRKAVAAPFSQDLMSLVWTETLRHTLLMLQGWTCQFDGKIPSLDNDLRTLTFNVLGATAFQEPTQSRQSENDVASSDGETYAENYLNALKAVLQNAILLMLIPYRYLARPYVPQRLAKIGHAAITFQSILREVLAEEMDVLDGKSYRRGGLLTPLIRALRPDIPGQGNEIPSASARVKKGGLSIDEILGNSFVINFAGHDTVLLTLTFALTLLAVHPEVQEWLCQEVITISDGRLTSEWNYGLFSKLNRCQAVILETLRVFAPITGIPKVASDKAPSLRIGDRLLTIPPGTEIFPLLLGVQTDAKYWKDPYKWRPSRWILHDDNGHEKLLVPRKGTFFPWSEGPQNCVGKKYSQVEGVAVLACLFRRHRLRVEAKAGETQEQARIRVRSCAEDVNYNLLLRMNHPERVKLRCIPVDASKSRID